MQRDQWTFDGSVEVTVNFFSLHAYHLLLGHDIPEIAWLRDQKNSIDKFLTKHKKPCYDDWKSDYGVGLYTFAVLFNHFGWESLYRFLEEYERDLNFPERSDCLPADNQEKLDQWVLRYSNIVKFNIAPHFRRFGLPVSNNVDKWLAYLKPLVIDIQPNTFFEKKPYLKIVLN